VKTAGQVPNPTLNVSPGQYPALIDASAWTVGFLVNFVLEIAGKRERRIELARNLVEAARQDIATASWQVRGRVRSALLELWAAEKRIRLIERRQLVQEQVVGLLERRFAAGESTALDLARERISRDQIKLSVRGAERQAAEARARLAAAVGVPVRAIEPVQLGLGAFDQPAEMPDVGKLANGSLRQAALQERTDVLGMLAEYEASQSALRLEVAKQYPNITLGPGYTYDQGFDLYTFGLSMDLPIFNQNQGPIAEAEARRREATAKFIALQARIIGDIDRAAASYRAAARTLATADALVQRQARQRQQLERAYQLGEVDRLAPLTAEMELALIELSRFEALVQQREALELIEDALQRSMFDGSGLYIRLPERMPRQLQFSARQ
jgi:outer membrane protein TolC